MYSMAWVNKSTIHRTCLFGKRLLRTDMMLTLRWVGEQFFLLCMKLNSNVTMLKLHSR
jgi:hypothetical protein